MSTNTNTVRQGKPSNEIFIGKKPLMTYGTAYLSSKGSAILKSKYYVILALGLSGTLVYFGLGFLISSLL